METRKLGCGALLLSSRLISCPPEMTRQIPKEPAILLFQRGCGAPTFPGCFGGPGGIFEVSKDANAAATAVRECEEETNIVFEPDEVEPFYEGRMADRDLQYFVGNWSIPETGICHNDHESIGHVWANSFLALSLSRSGILSFHYAQAVKKLVSEGLL